ncbi:MAG TPA: YfiR/HmsC family protein [Bacteroidales bacterium]|nr:YfiR/HmsC family protein [Bacteroidales bacterium]HPR13185.1 YfiR/HmsC family protein [Bacteroidales bacterium]HRW83926.1 YfiR/HmsC family protein [Bacteroidales bacterium]
MGFKIFRRTIVTLSLIMVLSCTFGQGGFNNSSRALYIFDLVSKYVDFGEDFADSSQFKIGMMLGDYELLYELGNLAKTRSVIQGKPVQVSGYKRIESLTHTQVLYVNRSAGFDLKEIGEAISGRKTLLVTEGYEFRESMINFIVINGVPRYEINEEYIRKEGMSVPQTFLFSAVKTREDWQELFNEADADLKIQKETVKRQQEEIEVQKAEILRQRSLLDSLDREIALKEEILKEGQDILNTQMEWISRQQDEIADHRQTIQLQQREVQGQKDTLMKQKEDIRSQIALIDLQLEQISIQEEKIRIQLATLEKQKLILWFVVLALVMVSVLGYYIYRGYMIKKDANIRLEDKNRTISMQKDEIERQRDLAAAQRDQIAYQKKHITDSIMYARRIQTALIPSLELFSDRLEHFVIYKPLAIVSGDFYWVSRLQNKQIIIVADCTGHGVPGAFMSMLGVTLLNEIVNTRNIIMPDQIIENLRQGVIRSLRQAEEQDSVKDGMDISVCVVDFDEGMLLWSGANSPLYLVRGNELIHYRADKMPASIHYRMLPFTLHRIKLVKDDTFYIFSDGFADQFGGPAQKKFLSHQLKEKLVEMSGIQMLEQAKRLNDIFETWQGDSPQVDDVTLIGVRY